MAEIFNKFSLVGILLVLFALPAIVYGSSITINSDKTINVNGNKTFPVYMYSYCNKTFENNCGVPACDPSKNGVFLFSGGGGDSYTNVQGQKAAYESAGELYTLKGSDINNISNNAPTLITSPSFFGYYSIDEPDLNGKTTADTMNIFNNVKAKDPNHPVILNICCSGNMKTWAPSADIMSWDNYTIRDRSSYLGDPARYWPRADSIYVYEQWSDQNVLNGFHDVNQVGKPVWAVIQANGVKEGDRLPPTPQEARANTYTAITMDVKGIGYWSYLGWGGSNTPTAQFPNCTSGLYNNSSLYNYYKQLGNELTSLNNILIFPTKDYQWHYHPGTQVNFSNVITKTVLQKSRTNFNYTLKEQGSTKYLIVVNKDASSITTDITVSGLTGTMTAKTLGLETSGSSRAGRTLTVTNGKFTDSFDGYAAHVYEVSSTVPLPTTCNNNILDTGEACDFSATPTGCTAPQTCNSSCTGCVTPPPSSSCPDGTCNGTETNATCPSDCSVPAPPPATSNSTVPTYNYAPVSMSFGNTASLNSVNDITGGITNWIVGLASSIFIIFIIIGGLMYISASGDEERITQAKKLIIYTIIGLSLLLISYSVYTTLNTIIWG